MKIRKSLLYLFCLSLPFNLYGQDWPNFNRYRQDNYGVGMPAENENRIVFMGNSITEGIGSSRVTANFAEAKIDGAFSISDNESLPVLFDLME